MVSMLKIFRDTNRMIARCIKKRIGIAEGMAIWIDYCEGQFPSKVWARIRKLDYEADYDGLTLWLTDLLRSEPPPVAINGLWFGLYNPGDEVGNESCQLYLAGSDHYREGDPDWHCRPAYFPEGRYADSQVLPILYQSAHKLGEDAYQLGEVALCLGYVGLVLARWTRGPMGERLRGVSKSRAVAFGHDSGDIHLVGVLEE